MPSPPCCVPWHLQQHSTPLPEATVWFCQFPIPFPVPPWRRGIMQHVRLNSFCPCCSMLMTSPQEVAYGYLKLKLSHTSYDSLPSLGRGSRSEPHRALKA